MAAKRLASSAPPLFSRVRFDRRYTTNRPDQRCTLFPPDRDDVKVTSSPLPAQHQFRWVSFYLAAHLPRVKEGCEMQTSKVDQRAD